MENTFNTCNASVRYFAGAQLWISGRGESRAQVFVWETAQWLVNDSARNTSVSRTHHCEPTFAHAVYDTLSPEDGTLCSHKCLWHGEGHMETRASVT